MDNEFRFSQAELEAVIEEGMVYMCACPAQVAAEISQLRKLMNYQQSCKQQANADLQVHQKIAEAALAAHQILEQCMHEVLMIEGWDRATLKMPEHLRIRRDHDLGLK